MTKEELEAERDRLGNEAYGETYSWEEPYAIEVFSQGFNAAVKLIRKREVEPREKELADKTKALENVRLNGCQSCSEFVEKVLTKYSSKND